MAVAIAATVLCAPKGISIAPSNVTATTATARAKHGATSTMCATVAAGTASVIATITATITATDTTAAIESQANGPGSDPGPFSFAFQHPDGVQPVMEKRRPDRDVYRVGRPNAEAVSHAGQGKCRRRVLGQQLILRISPLETERYDPSLPLAFAIAKLFKLKIEDIFESE